MSKGRHIGKRRAVALPEAPFFRLAEPWEQRPLKCSARRSKTSRVYCTEMALHAHPHCSRGRFGQWFIWPLRSY